MTESADDPLTLMQNHHRQPASALCTLIVCVVASLTANAQLGNVTAVEDRGRTVIVRADSAALRFTFFRPEIVRVDYLPRPATIFDSSIVVIRDTTDPVSVRLLENDSTIELSTSGLSIVCARTPLRVRYRSAAGATVLEETSAGGFRSIGPLRDVRFRLHGDEHFYGTGERGTALDHRGWSFRSYNTQVFGYSTPQPTMMINVPLVVSSRGYALYFENTYPGWFDFGTVNPEVLSYTVEGGELSCFLMVAPTIAEQLELYTWLTGRQPLPPRWALGYLQSRYGYRTEAEARDVVRTLRERRIPCDAVILDLDWFRHMGDLAWNPASWPDPFGMMRDFLNQGVKTIVITEPYVVEYSPNFAVAASAGYLAQEEGGVPYRLSNWWSCGCDAALVDFTNAAARSWWWAQHPGFMGEEMAGLWTDLGEPERHPSAMRHLGGPAERIHNTFNLLWAATLFDGFSTFRPEARIFNLTRSGYAGIQRYGALTWSGDVARSFGGLSLQPRLMLGMGLSGLAYHNSDIGGFAFGPTTPELYIRWMQYGTLSPIARAHGSRYPTEPWEYGAEAEAIARSFIELRYRLLPYLYTLAWENSRTGMPLARPLFFLDPGDPSLSNESESYLLGEDLLVSPVTVNGAREKTVRLPPGTWIDFWTRERLMGPATVTLPAPLERIPLLVRAGAILPMQTAMQHAAERPLDTLYLEVYTNTGVTGSTTIYEDDGETLRYRSGAYTLTSVTQSFAPGAEEGTFTLSVGPSSGAYDGKPDHRLYWCNAYGIPGKPATVSLNGIPLDLLRGPEEEKGREGGYRYDQTTQTLSVLFGASADSAYLLEAAGIVLAAAFEEGEPPGHLRLDPAFPNPFNSTTVISFRVPERGRVRLSLLDLLGREVMVLLDQELGAGSHRRRLDASALAAGVYFLRLQGAGPQATAPPQVRKILLVK